MVGVPAKPQKVYICIMYFFSATILNWQNLLEENRMKDIVIESMQWLSESSYCAIHGFVIMPNHIHILWSALGGNEINEVEKKLTSFTAHQFKKKLMLWNPDLIGNYVSTQGDRAYHFWERRPRSIKIESRDIAEQKLDYIHANPMQGKWRLCTSPEEYVYSSAAYYEGLSSRFSFLQHYMEWS